MSEKEKILVFYNEDQISHQELDFFDNWECEFYLFRDLEATLECLETKRPKLILFFHAPDSQDAQSACIRFSELTMFDESSMIFLYQSELPQNDFQLLTTLGVSRFISHKDMKKELFKVLNTILNSNVEKGVA